MHISTDASLTGGVVVLKHPSLLTPVVLSWPWAGPHRHTEIYLLELLALYVGVCLAAGLVAPSPSGDEVADSKGLDLAHAGMVFHIDNMGLVHSLRKLHSKLPVANRFLEEIHHLLRRRDWRGEWVSTLENEADGPSRRFDPRAAF
jgi:hypothetical protein